MKRGYKRIFSFFVLLLTLVSGGLCGPVQAFASPAKTAGPVTPQKMEVHYINVGQGDSTLIKCGNQAALIDAGDDSKGTLIQNYLKKQGIKKLDYLILTHPDTDHIGGAPVIITKFDIDKVFVSNYEKDNKAYQKLIQALDNKRLKCSTPEAGTGYPLGTATLTILAPNDEYDNPNDSSIALMVQNGSNKFLFSGDAGEDAEADILSNKMDVSADVYKAGHHGSKFSTSQDFFNAVSPTYAVISCGEGNAYGHPHAETLNTFRMNGVDVYRTDEDGTIIATSDGEDIIFNVPPSESWKAGEFAGSLAEAAQPKAQQPAQEKEVVSDPAPVIEEPELNGITYVLNNNTKKFHNPDCGSVDTIKSKNREDTTKTRDEIIGAGYVPCKKCNP